MRSLFVIILLGLFIAIGLTTVSNLYFRVSHIECRFDEAHVCPTQLEEKLEPLKSRSIFFLNVEQFIADQVSPTYPVSLKAVKKTLPGSLEIILFPEHTIYLLNSEEKNSNDQYQYVVSDSGLIFKSSQTNTQQLPVAILPEEKMNNKQVIDQKTHQFIVDVIDASDKENLVLAELVWISELEVELRYQNLEEKFVVDDQDPIKYIKRIAVLLNSDEYQDVVEKKAILDLRFELPVLRTAP